MADTYKVASDIKQKMEDLSIYPNLSILKSIYMPLCKAIKPQLPSIKSRFDVITTLIPKHKSRHQVYYISYSMS